MNEKEIYVYYYIVHDCYNVMLGAFSNEEVCLQWLYDKFKSIYPDKEFSKENILDEINAIDNPWTKDGEYSDCCESCSLIMDEGDDIDKINDVWILMDTCDEVDWTESTPYKAFSSKESAIKGIIDAIHEKESMVDDDEVFSDEECQEFAENIIDSCQDPLKMEFDWDNNSCPGFECLTVVHLPLIK